MSIKTAQEGCGKRCLLAHNLSNKIAVIIGQSELLLDDANDLSYIERFRIIDEIGLRPVPRP